MLVILDNYDSFTYNLYHLLGDEKARVIRNDELDLAGIQALNPAAIVISPGPSRPENAGISIDVVRTFASRIPILGVCLGMQAIAVAFGGRIVRAAQVMHGKVSSISHSGRGLFCGLSQPLQVGRYHSLIVEHTCLPASLIVEAQTQEGTIMALQHRDYPCFGVQFHPESLLTPNGKQLVQNFLALAYATPSCQ